ncbi:hypothetical protein [Streptomyces sp. Ru73]|uniref:hypothetical protein n=1 Tax=Streptomyces sp. Ru73 TaxID=2080748 RepID=UPI0015E3BF5A|nr:hypothetical protein [Streptomyces sp. Ru73]
MNELMAHDTGKPFTGEAVTWRWLYVNAKRSSDHEFAYAGLLQSALTTRLTKLPIAAA